MPIDVSYHNSCPYNVSIALSSWHNYSMSAFNGSRLRYDDYVCHYASYNRLKRVTQPIERQLIILFSSLGFVGGLLTICTLSQKRFRGLDFQLYRLIGYLEMIQMMDLAVMDLLAYIGCPKSYVCTFVWAHIGFVIMNICADSVDILVLFLCIERTVACLLPYYFQRLHNRTRYNLIVCISIIVPTFFSSFQAFELRVVYEREHDRYRDEPSEFSQTPFYVHITRVNTARFYIMAATILLATACSVWGYYAMAKRRTKLSRDYTMNSWVDRSVQRSMCSMDPISSSSIEQQHSLRTYVDANGASRPAHQAASSGGKRARRETELCCLQLCLAVPIIINHLLYASGLNMNRAYVVGESALKRGLDFESAWRELERLIVFYSLRMATNVTNVLAHALHFYLYLLFSVQVRHGFVMLLRTWRQKVVCKKHGNALIANRAMTNEMSITRC